MTVYITKQGATIAKTSERLKVVVQKEVLVEVPLIKVSQVVIFGKSSVTPSAMRELMKRNIEICYLTQFGDYIARTQPEISKNIPLRMAQFKAQFDEGRCLELARGFVLGKLLNLRKMLSRKGGKAGKDACKRAAERIQAAELAAQKTGSLNALRGHEGDGSAAYFSVFNHLLKPDDVTFEKRVRRPPTDPVNALLSFGYTLLMNDVLTAVNLVGFDPYVGYLHTPQYGRPSLALDLMEEFRPLIVDALVLACFNKKMLTPESFAQRGATTVRLTDEGRRTFLQQYEQRRKTEFTYAVTGQKITYLRAFEEQARLLGRVLQGDVDRYAAVSKH